MESKKPWKQCLSYGCGELVRDGAYCVKHKNERVKLYDKYERNKESRTFYASTAWKKVRAYVMARDQGLCQHCLKDKKITKADVVHHIKYLVTHPELALSPSNLISICHSCHNDTHKND